MSEGIRAEALKSNRWADLARKALSCALAECSVDSVCVVVGLVFARSPSLVWELLAFVEVVYSWVLLLLGRLHYPPRMTHFLAASLLTELLARVRTERKFCNAEEVWWRWLVREKSMG